MLLLRGFMEKQNDHGRDQLKQCILSIRKGNQRAFDQLLAEYTPLVESQVLQYGKELTQQDREDLRQEALYALHRSALNYDFDQSGVEFGLYAKICIGNALISQLRLFNRRRSEIFAEVVEVEQGAPFEDPASRLIEEECAQALYRRVRRVLSDYENRVWGYVMLGYSAGQIAKLLNKPPHSIENAVYRIRQKLRREFAPDDAQN